MTDDEPWFPSLTPVQELDRELAIATEEQLADTIGLECVGCHGLIRGRLAIGAWTYMAPVGSGDYCAQAYCRSCADALQESWAE